MSTIAYHERELEIALDAQSEGHCLPQLPDNFDLIRDRVLDIGCGRGQTLVALNIPSHSGFGIDPDSEAVSHSFGQHNLQVGTAEKLPFADADFQFVYSRVALMYSDIPKSLKEIHRVLAPDGELWLSMHPWSMLGGRISDSIRNARPKDLAFCAYLVLNSIALNFGLQFAYFNGRFESVQSESAMTAALQRADFDDIHIQRGKHFVITARKAS